MTSAELVVAAATADRELQQYREYLRLVVRLAHGPELAWRRVDEELSLAA
jgi:hypothetical protein